MRLISARSVVRIHLSPPNAEEAEESAGVRKNIDERIFLLEVFFGGYSEGYSNGH